MVRAPPRRSAFRGTVRWRNARMARATTRPTASTGWTTATGASARAATWSPVPDAVASCPTTHFGLVTSRRHCSPLADVLPSAASCCSTAPTAKSTAHSTASSAPAPNPAAGLDAASASTGPACPRHRRSGARSSPRRSRTSAAPGGRGRSNRRSPTGWRRPAPGGRGPVPGPERPRAERSTGRPDLVGTTRGLV